MYHNERRALVSFLLIYILSSIIMLGSVGFFYYKEKLATIDRMCGVTMENLAMQVKVKLMKKSNIDIFFDKTAPIKVGLFDKNKKPIRSNLTTKKVNFNQINYNNRTSAFFTMELPTAINKIEFIVIEDSKLSETMEGLKSLILLMLIVASFFIALVGYFLSRLLLKPVKENFAILSRFMKDSAHELNTPVTALMMSANYLKKEYDEEMVEHMLMSSKMISETYNSIAYLAFHDLDIEIKEEFNLCEHIYDSIKYSPNNSTIEIILENNILQIKDEGPGISEVNQKKIFKRYKRLGKKGTGGFGIGLDIVMGICRKNNIDISLESEEGKGSVFILEFPL